MDEHSDYMRVVRSLREWKPSQKPPAQVKRWARVDDHVLWIGVVWTTTAEGKLYGRMWSLGCTQGIQGYTPAGDVIPINEHTFNVLARMIGVHRNL